MAATEPLRGPQPGDPPAGRYWSVRPGDETGWCDRCATVIVVAHSKRHDRHHQQLDTAAKRAAGL